MFKVKNVHQSKKNLTVHINFLPLYCSYIRHHQEKISLKTDVGLYQQLIRKHDEIFPQLHILRGMLAM